MKEIDFEELEKEIDRAIDTLFVTKGEAKKRQEQPLQASLQEGLESRRTDEEIQRKLEGIEVELLTLEWEFRQDGIRRALGLLQELRDFELPDGMQKAAELLQKTLHRFITDEAVVTPEGVRFVQEVWQFLKAIAEGKGHSQERLKELGAAYLRLFEERVPVAEIHEGEAPQLAPSQELLRAWERLEQILSETIARLQGLKGRVAEERRALLSRTLSPGQRRTMALFRAAEEYFALHPAFVAKVVSLSREMATAFLERGVVRLRDGAIPLHRVGGAGYKVGDNPVVVIFRGEKGLKGVIADEALGSAEVTITSPGRGKWKRREIKLVM